MQRHEINAASAPQPASRYSQAVEVSGGTRLLFISGQPGMEADGSTPPGIGEQARLAWRNLEAQLSAAGMGFDNLVKLTVILPDRADLPAFSAARAEVLRDRRPASTLLIANLADPAWRVEIEAIACA